jgi:hypothetical protein
MSQRSRYQAERSRSQRDGGIVWQYSAWKSENANVKLSGVTERIALAEEDCPPDDPRILAVVLHYMEAYCNHLGGENGINDHDAPVHPYKQHAKEQVIDSGCLNADRRLFSYTPAFPGLSQKLNDSFRRIF